MKCSIFFFLTKICLFGCRELDFEMLHWLPKWLLQYLFFKFSFYFWWPFVSTCLLQKFELRFNRFIASTLPKLLFYFCRFVNSWKWWMVLQRKMAQVQIHCAEPWVWLSTMMLSVVHQNSMWLMTMPNALLLVQQNVRYVKNIAFVNVVSSFLFIFFFFYFAKYFGMQLLLICCFSYLLAIWDIWCY